MDRYPTIYSDVRGVESTTIESNGEELKITLRGVSFAGRDLESLEPLMDTPPVLLQQFSLHHGDLCSCRLECQIPVPVHDHGVQKSGTFSVELILGDPAPNGGLDREELWITLEYDGRQYVGPGTSGWFEDELLAIQARLPEGVYFKACINCMYSDYSPYGHGLFGWMMCFRNLKAEYRKVTTKREFWAVHDKYDRLVQETYLCPEFERRVPRTGYRG